MVEPLHDWPKPPPRVTPFRPCAKCGKSYRLVDLSEEEYLSRPHDCTRYNINCECGYTVEGETRADVVRMWRVREEPALVSCGLRGGDEMDMEWHLECRFSDGQKFAAVEVDQFFPKLAERVCDALNNTARDAAALALARAVTGVAPCPIDELEKLFDAFKAAVK